eukprot:g16431.t1
MDVTSLAASEKTLSLLASSQEHLDADRLDELTAKLFSAEGQAQCLASRLLWRTPFLKRTAEVIAIFPFHAPSWQKEFLGHAAVSCGVESHKNTVGGMLLEALVAHIAQHCQNEAPGTLMLFCLLESILEACGAAPAVRETLCRRCPRFRLCFILLSHWRLPRDNWISERRSIESSSALIFALVAMMTSESEIPEESSALLLRLLERGQEVFLAPLALQSNRVARGLAEAKPNGSKGTALLAFYRMCALHPALFNACLSSHSDLTEHAESIAVGLSRHLATGEPFLVAAAAGLVEDFGVAFAGEDTKVEGWLRKAQLSQWLIEALSRTGDVAAQSAVCAALRSLGEDPKLRPLFPAAADALMDPGEACSSSWLLAATELERRQLLRQAAEALEPLVAEGLDAGVFAPRMLIPLLHAARDLSKEGTLSLDDCLEPDLWQFWQVVLQILQMLGQLFVMLAQATWAARCATAVGGTFLQRHDGLGDVTLLLRFAQKLGTGSAGHLLARDLWAALSAMLWPMLQLDGMATQEEVSSFKECCLQLGHLVPQLFETQLSEAELQGHPGPEVVLDEDPSAGQLLSVLLVPFLTVDANSLSVVFLTCAVARAAARAVSVATSAPSDAVEWLALVELGAARLRRAAAKSMAEGGALEEWRLLKCSSIPNGHKELTTALGWLLASADEEGTEPIEADETKEKLLSPAGERSKIEQQKGRLPWPGIFFVEYLTFTTCCKDPEFCRKHDMWKGDVGVEKGQGVFVAHPGEWCWLRDCLPSPRWMSSRVEVLLGHALQARASR